MVRVHLPPLRERGSDVSLLAAYFINKFRLKHPSGPSQIASEALVAIQAYNWPGNVRELENCIQRAMVLATGNTITLANLPDEVAKGYRKSLAAKESAEVAPAPVTLPIPAATLEAPVPVAEPVKTGTGPAITLAQAIDTLFEFARKDEQFKIIDAAERELIVRALAETSGNQVQASKLLGITRATLRKRVDTFGIQKRMEID